MPRNKANEEEEGGWINTYADMVTLLLTFFVLLYSMSSVDSEKWQNLVEAFARNGDEIAQVVVTPEGDGQEIGENKGSGPTDDLNNVDISQELPEDFDQLYLYLKKFIEENQMEGSIDLTKGDNSVFIRFNDNIFFNPDSYMLKKTSMPLLDFMGSCFKNVEEQVLVICINGHTADVDIENYPVSARRLSSQRADSVAIFFEEEKYIEGAKIVSRGYANYFPIATNETAEGRSKNRRVDITIVNNKGTLTEVEDLYHLINGTVEVDSSLDAREPIEVVLPRVGDTVDISDHQEILQE